MNAAANPFPDLDDLLEISQPRPRLSWLRLGITGFLISVFVMWYLGRGGQATQQAFPTLVLFALSGLILSMGFSSLTAMRAARAEQASLERIDELIQLRRWPEAVAQTRQMLSRPMRSPGARAQGLLYVAMLLSRYHQFEQSVRVHDYILQTIGLDEAAAQAVRLGRAVALLREDNLLDADRAIADLRRETRGTDAPGLALVEIYRDVKTGHPAEAIEMFESRLPALRKTLGQRLADAWGLAARAYDLLGRETDARAAWENATLLMPMTELCRRYPELNPMAQKLAPASTPMEVA